MNYDLAPLLEGWDYTTGETVARMITGVDGREKVQLRLDLGVLQMELDGRPDGQKVEGRDSLLDHFRAQAQEFEERQTEELTFKLDNEDCSRLHAEAVQYYHRYVALFHLRDWKRVIRDTQRNLALFDFVEDHAEHPMLTWSFQQFRAYVINLRTRAQAQVCLDDQQVTAAVALINEGIDEIRGFFRRHRREELIPQSGEIRSLEEWREKLLRAVPTTKLNIPMPEPLTERLRFEKALEEAIAREDYEAAAALRDSIRQMDASST
ncbi:hypothetical protein DB346_24925 [Verrucomicrobia bacterium LW23]|nr:hypothetical protein DB346_24925 [Verrucomicrobia bacterium LW23]